VTFAVQLTSQALFSTAPDWFFFGGETLEIESRTIKRGMDEGDSINTKVYAFLSNPDQTIMGYQYNFLTLTKNEETLFANITQTYIEVGKNKILYVDASNSEDSRIPFQPLSIRYYNFDWDIVADSPTLFKWEP